MNIEQRGRRANARESGRSENDEKVDKIERQRKRWNEIANNSEEILRNIGEGKRWKSIENEKMKKTWMTGTTCGS